MIKVNYASKQPKLLEVVSQLHYMSQQLQFAFAAILHHFNFVLMVRSRILMSISRSNNNEKQQSLFCSL